MADEFKPTEDLRVTHTFHAPIERVWQAWTDDKVVERWWYVDGFSNILAKIDVRQGGVSHVGNASFKGIWRRGLLQCL
jgi:uncharacterized protein YndB with AHSA1/START domain